MPIWFDADGSNGGHVAIYTGSDDAPMANPSSYIGTRTKFSTKFNYIPFVPSKKIGPVSISIPVTVSVPDGSVHRRVIDLGAHGAGGVPFVYGFVTIGSTVRPLCGTVPVKLILQYGGAITFTLVVTPTNVLIVENRDYHSYAAASGAVEVTVYVSDKLVLDTPDDPVGNVDITETYLVAGDYDSRKRYLKKGSTNTLAIASGVTWTRGERGSIDGSVAVAWRWSLGSRGSATFEPGSLDAPAPSPLLVTDCTL